MAKFPEEIKIKIVVDTTELDEALEKATRLQEQCQYEVTSKQLIDVQQWFKEYMGRYLGSKCKNTNTLKVVSKDEFLLACPGEDSATVFDGMTKDYAFVLYDRDSNTYFSIGYINDLLSTNR